MTETRKNQKIYSVFQENFSNLKQTTKDIDPNERKYKIEKQNIDRNDAPRFAHEKQIS